MKLLLDTHIMLWLFQNNSMLGKNVRDMILAGDNEIYYSVVSAWEVSMKNGAHPDLMLLDGKRFLSLCESSGFEELPLFKRHILTVETLCRPENTPLHKDPFDKMLIAQAKADGLVFLTHDRKLTDYGEECVRLV